ncbi:MAG: hypothetical protein Q7R45_07610, partial [Sulfuricaulis sp.]|nr:hypothetical protein [Sulfuricaulis sp.]
VEAEREFSHCALAKIVAGLHEPDRFQRTAAVGRRFDLPVRQAVSTGSRPCAESKDNPPSAGKPKEFGNLEIENLSSGIWEFPSSCAAQIGVSVRRTPWPEIPDG